MLFSLSIAIIFSWNLIEIKQRKIPFKMQQTKKKTTKKRMEVYYLEISSGAGKGGKGGSRPPNFEKDGPRNSSKFDEKLGRGWVSISDVKKS